MKSLPSRVIALSAGLGALVFGAYLWLGPANGGAWSDGMRRVDDSRALRVMTWSEPIGSRALPVEAAAEQRLAFSPDGRHVVWSQPSDTGHDLFVAELRDGVAAQPRALSGANSDADDRAPAFGGDFLYFASNRAGGAGGFDLWRARFEAGEAKEVALLPGPANGPGDELDPAPVPGEERVVFVAARDDAGLDLYAAPLGAGEVERIDRLCSDLDEREPSFSPDGRALVFASDREGDRGFDLYRSARFEQRFSTPAALIAVNGVGDERAPAPTVDGLGLEFLRVADGRIEELHSHALELFRELGRPISWMEWLALVGLLALALLAWLARRYPELDRLTQCVLVSVVVHLLLMWWFHDLWLSGSAFQRPPRERAPIQIRLETPTPEVVPEPEPAEPVVVAEEVAPSVASSRSPSEAPSVATLELPATPPSSPREQARQPERASPSRRTAEASPASPRPARPDASVATAAEATPTPARESTLPEVARTGSVRASAVEPAPAAPAERPRELALPSPTTATRAVREPDRAERGQRPSPSRAAAEAPRTSVARAASALESPTPRTSEADAPSPRRETALALRDSEPAAAVAAQPAPSLALDAASAGAPSMSSRAMGEPRRSSSGPARGAPAANSGLGSVARAASPSRDAERAARRVERADPNAGAAAARSASPEDDATGEDVIARSAAGAPALNLDALGEPGSAGGPSRAAPSDADAAGHGPQRAAPSARRGGSGTAGGGAAPRALRSEDLARAAEAREGVEARPSPSSASQPRTGTDLGELEFEESADSGNDVARSAEPAPAVELNGLEVARASGSQERSPAGDSAPSRANVATRGGARSLPRADPRASTARSAQAPQSAPERSRGAVGASEPSSSARIGELALDPGDAGDVAQPAARGDAESEGEGWVGELAPVSRGDVASAEASADLARGPERARAPASTPRSDARPSAQASTARAGSAPETDTPARASGTWDRTPYQNRSGAQRARALELYGGDESTEAAVERGLAYLARIQNRDGSWGDLDVIDEKYGQVAIGKTALCTLAFLGAGHTPQSATTHSAVVDRAIRFLVSTQDDASGHFGPASAYDHGIATYAIGECLALTGDTRLREVLERAIAQVLRTQSRGDDPRFAGGWGYYHADGSLYDPWPRTSITAWQVMALESARLSGLDVPDAAFDAVRGFLERAHDPRLGAYRYNHDPERLSSAYPTLPASTPAALFALALLGEDVAGPEHRVARDYVLRRAPDGYRYSGEADFVHLARGNPYFWYYGTLAMFRVGGAEWQRWNAALKESLLPAQTDDGSWRPIDVYARYARDTNADRSYTTALCVLSLEVYYRYYLPLLKVR